jgi:hypothetical protein
MKKLIACLLLTAACALGQEQVLNLGSRGKITLYLLGDWKATVIDMAGQYEVTFAPKNDEINASCSLKVSYPEVDRYDTKARLKLRVEADCAPFTEQSVEGKAYAKEFNTSTGYGYYCSFTDAALRGAKKAPPGEFKVVSAGKIRLAPDVLLEVFIGADSFKDEAYQQLLGAIEGMEFKPGRGR